MSVLLNNEKNFDSQRTPEKKRKLFGKTNSVLTILPFMALYGLQQNETLYLLMFQMSNANTPKVTASG